MTRRRYNTREFSYTRPIMFQGEYYPSADSVISDEYGNKTEGRIFADANGQYYTKDKGNNVFPVMPVENLDDVVITAQDKREPLLFNRYLTRNDKTQVNNLPHREYNTSLKINAERGAKEHALWDKEHPNLASWRDTTTAVPFGIASIPLVAGGGQTLLGTAAGQAIKGGVSRVLDNPIIEAANKAVGLGFAGMGAYDVSQGKFTPETAMDFMGLYPATKSLTGLTKPKAINRSTKGILGSNVGSNPFINEDIVFNYKQDPLEMHYARARAKGYSPNRIEYYNLSEDSDKNMQLMKKLAPMYGVTPEELLAAYRNHLATKSGHAAALTDVRNTIIHDGKLPKSHASAILSHEADHALHIPDEPVPDGALFPRIYLRGNYFKSLNNTEVAARGSQLHDYFGHTGTEPITADELKYAREHYIKDTGINNNMYDFLWSINDYDALAKWMTKYSTGIVPLGIIGNNQLNNNE
ncbi:hypothetical protein [Streptococcus vestibularis]|uniref:hypothetical protein n=1 Tax=Streptococcus vestibularis TaxID=1343 RepID=UPI0026F2B8F5|nr:hypothetical protein [Streptococcus vestibularis]